VFIAILTSFVIAAFCFFLIINYYYLYRVANKHFQYAFVGFGLGTLYHWNAGVELDARSHSWL